MPKVSPSDDRSGPERAGLYVRVSTRKQAADGLSLGEQERRGRAFVESRGMTLTEVYADAASGKTDEHRPQLQRMLAAAEAGEFDVLIIPKIDRFGRNFRDSAKLKGRLEDAGVRLVAMDSGLDFSTGTGLIVWGTLSAVAQMENETRADRISYVSEARARQGKVYGGRRAPYGYRRRIDGPGIVPDPVTAPIALSIFEQAAAGASPEQITYGLNGRAVPTLEGAEWKSQNVRRMLRNPTYFGGVTHKGALVCERGEHEPIVARMVWDKATAAAGARRALPASGGGRKPKGGHLLRGLLTCGICGRTLSTRTYPSGKAVYHCTRARDHRDKCPGSTPYPREVIDCAVLDYFNRVGLDMEATRAAFAQHAARRIAEAEAVRAGAERDEAEAAERLHRVRGDYLAKRISPEDWADFRPELTDGLAAARAHAERCRQAEADALDAAELRDAETDVLRHLADLRRGIVDDLRHADTLEHLRAVLVRLFDGFTLHDEDAMARASLVPDRAGHGWQRDLFVTGPDGATVYLEPHVRAVVVDGFEAPAAGLEHAPATAFPVLKREALSPPETRARNGAPTG